LLELVTTFGKEFEIVIFNKTDIDSEFMKNNMSILNCSRGGGYWLWKPYIITKTLEKINEGDVIFYLDSKYYFIEEFTQLYSDYIVNNDLLVWKNKPNEPIWFMKNWCKMDVLQKYNMIDKVFYENAVDCWGGALVVKKTADSVQYMDEWLKMCCIYEDITDSPSQLENSPIFREHRHDQSLLSIVLHKHNIQMQYFEKKYLQNVRCPY